MALEGSVIIALDGSPHSAQTLGWGMAEASLRRTDAVLVRATPDTLDINRLGWYPLVEDDLFEAQARDYLAATLADVRERWPDVPARTLLLHGPEVPVLRDVSKDAGLLVVGARGRGERRRLGSTGSHVVAHAHCPVALVRALPASTSPRAPVVVGVDGSPASVAAARVASDEAALRGVRLVVVHARPEGAAREGVTPAAGASDGAGAAPRSVEEVATLLVAEHAGLDVGVDVRDGGSPHALVAAAQDAQLLVVGSRGLGAFRGLLLGSVSAEVLRRAEVPVLVVRARSDLGTDAGA